LNLFYQPAIAQGTMHLDLDESRHAVKVLRMQQGGTIHLTDGLGFLYTAIIHDANPKKCSFTISEMKEISKRNFSVAIAIAPTKNIDRTEWFVEKAIEIGIEEIYFMVCKCSERKTVNMERIHKIAISAMKQSGQARQPHIHTVAPFGEVIGQARLPLLHEMAPFGEMVGHTASQKFICQVDAANPVHLKSLAKARSNYLVLIGPEGDFTQEEIQQATANGFQKVSLGPNRLRTETAALTACQILNFVNL
jgi:16S rRNA (uracil1498-N3)-methyltransferase